MGMMSENIAYQSCRAVLAPLFRLVYHPVIIGAEKIPAEGPVILAGNHKHAFDPLLVDISTKRTVHALAKSELFQGAGGFFFSAIGAIPVDLEAAKNPDAYASAKEALLKGGAVNISPEAARNYTEDILLPFKSGAVRLARETGTVIIPYSITGEYRFRSKDLKIVFGDPFIVEADEDIKEANERLFHTIEKLILENRQ